jgi:adenosylhomocysteine nucleosidase
MTRTAIIAAMPGELKPLVRGWEHERRGDVHLWRWRFDEGEWVAACAGAGQQAATRAFAAVERDGPVDICDFGGLGGGAERAESRPGKAYRVSGVIDSKTGERFQASSVLERVWLVTSPRVADGAEKSAWQRPTKPAWWTWRRPRCPARRHARGFRSIASRASATGLPRICLISIGLFRRGAVRDGRLLFFVLPRPWHWPALIRMGENSKQASQSIAESSARFSR